MKICDNLYKYLVLKLGKQDIEKEDLENIENLSLVFDKEEKINYDFKDLIYFKNLKELTIIDASINNFEINCINRIDTLPCKTPKAAPSLCTRVSSKKSLIITLEAPSDNLDEINTLDNTSISKHIIDII